MSELAAGAVCPGCGAANERLPCPTCASLVERRVVTVVFADLVGYTRLCANLDVEQVYLLVRPLMNALRRRCEELGGSVPVIEGDGFMAVFGARASQEDDPQRALFAAIEMQRLVDERRQAYAGELGGLRVGVNAGEVLVAPSQESMGFSVSGDPVNVASRLAGLASEGEVLVGSTLVELVPAAGIFGDERTAVVRNRDVPVAFRPLTWREIETSHFGQRSLSKSAYQVRSADQALRALVDGAGALHLVGEPGAGKSRALAELAQTASGPVFELRAPTFVGVPLRSQLAAALLMVERGERTSLQTRTLRRAAGLPVDSDEGDGEESLSDALLAELAALEGPLLLLDDVHLCDALDLSLITRVAQDLPRARLLVASRSDVSVPLPFDVVELTPLDEAGTRDLVHVLLPGAPERLVRSLFARSGGNPLFVEQGIALMLENGSVSLGPNGCTFLGADDSAVPVGMQVFVASRLDLLPDRLREVLSLAAVVGDPVDGALLRHLDGQREDVADVIELLVERGLLRWEQAEQLRFRHQVVRDVAYERLSRSQRLMQHRAAAEWYAAVPLVGLLNAEARHLEAAIALGHDDCDLVRRAVLVLGILGKALVEEAPSEALVVLARAESLAAEHPACQADTFPLVLGRASALHRLSIPAALEAARDAVAGAATSGDERLVADALMLRAMTAHWGDDEDLAALEQQALLLLEELDDRTGAARLRLSLAYQRAAQDLRILLDAAHDAFRIGSAEGDQRLATQAALDLAEFLPARDPGEARRWCDTASGMLRPHDLVGPARLAMSRAFIDSVTLRPREGLESAAALEAAAIDAELPRSAFYAHCFRAEAATELGLLDEAGEAWAEVAEGARVRPTPMTEIQVHLRRIALHSRRAEWEAVEESFAAADVLVETNGPYFESAVLEARGVHLLDRGHFDDAYVLLDRAHHLDEDLEQPALGLRGALSRLVAALASGRTVPLAEQHKLRSQARTLGAPAVAAVAARWLEVDDVLRRPHTHEPELPEAPDLPAARALDLELSGLRGDRSDLLLAAQEWASLGTVVWTARAQIWHSELTDRPPPEAEELLELLVAPPGLAETFRSQVRHLRR